MKYLKVLLVCTFLYGATSAQVRSKDLSKINKPNAGSNYVSTTGSIEGNIINNVGVSLCTKLFGNEGGCYSLQLLEATEPAKNIGAFVAIYYDLNAQFKGSEKVRIEIFDTMVNHRKLFSYKISNVPIHKKFIIVLHFNRYQGGHEDNSEQINNSIKLALKNNFIREGSKLDIKALGIVLGSTGQPYKNDLQIDEYVQPSIH